MKRALVVGAGLAGLRAAEQLRDSGFDGDLTVVGDERHHPYTRPPLSKQLLAGEMDDDGCAFECAGLEVSWALGQPAVGLDAHRRAVKLLDGEELPYDGLVLATGRRAKEWPDLPDLDGFFTLRTLDDCLALRAAVEAGPSVVIVGAGFIGCEVAATLRGRGIEVTLVEMGPQPMPALGAEAGGQAARIHEEHGVTLRLETSVEGFDGDGRVEAVRVSGGERIEADLVLLAVGSTPNTEWLEGSGLQLHHGTVLCDDRCVAVGVEGVVAAGDVAAWPHPHAPGPVWVEHWTHASDMGRAAAKSLLAEPDARPVYAPIPTFWSDQYDLKIKSAGLFGQATSTHVVAEEDERRLVVEGHRHDELLGAVIFNKNRAYIDYRKRLEESLADQPA